MQRQEKALWFGIPGRARRRKAVLQSVVITLITWFGGPTPAAAQDNGNLPPAPPIVYVSNGGGGIAEATALRGINNRSQVAGFYRQRDDPARHGFLATTSTAQGQDNNNQ